MFHHFCWPPSISLNFSVAAVLLRWGTPALAFRWQPVVPIVDGVDYPGIIRLAPHAFVFQWRYTPATMLSRWNVPIDLCGFHPSIKSTLNLVVTPPGAGGTAGFSPGTPPSGFHLQTLYTQSVRVTLAPSVLPRLLARI